MLKVPAGESIPRDYYSKDSDIAAEILHQQLSVSELTDLDAQFESSFEYFSETVTSLARQYGCKLGKIANHPESLASGTPKDCYMFAQIIGADSLYDTYADDDLYWMLWVTSNEYCAPAEPARIVVKGEEFSQGFSRQEIYNQVKLQFDRFKASLHDAEEKLDTAADTEARIQDALEMISDLCESYGCEFQGDVFNNLQPRNDTKLVNADAMTAIKCVLRYKNKTSGFWLDKYLDKPSSVLRKTVQARLRRLVDPNAKSRPARNEVEELSL